MKAPAATRSASHIISADPYRIATARVFLAYDNDGKPYYDWSVITNDGQMLAQDRDEMGDGEPTQADIEQYLSSKVDTSGPY